MVTKNNGGIDRRREEDRMGHAVFRALCCPSTQEAFRAEGATLRELAKKGIPGHEEVNLATTLLTQCVSQTVLAINVGKSMDEEQVADTVMAIIEDYPMMSVEEVATVLNQKRKRPGKLYDSLSMADIIGWLDEYDAQRDAYCEEEARQVPEVQRRGDEMDYETYVQWVRTEAAKGNPDAVRALEDMEYNLRRRTEREREEDNFKQWKKIYEEKGRL